MNFYVIVEKSVWLCLIPNVQGHSRGDLRSGIAPWVGLSYELWVLLLVSSSSDPTHKSRSRKGFSDSTHSKLKLALSGMRVSWVRRKKVQFGVCPVMGFYTYTRGSIVPCMLMIVDPLSGRPMPLCMDDGRPVRIIAERRCPEHFETTLYLTTSFAWPWGWSCCLSHWHDLSYQLLSSILILLWLSYAVKGYVIKLCPIK